MSERWPMDPDMLMPVLVVIPLISAAVFLCYIATAQYGWASAQLAAGTFAVGHMMRAWPKELR